MRHFASNCLMLATSRPSGSNFLLISQGKAAHGQIKPESPEVWEAALQQERHCPDMQSEYS